MFGKPEWFRAKAVGWGLRPQTWQGWVYALVWMITLGLPFIAFVAREQAPEALIWMTCASGVLVSDVWSIRRALRRKSVSDILYISESGECAPYR